MIEARNEADTLAYSMEKSLTEYKVTLAGGPLTGPVLQCIVLHTISFQCTLLFGMSASLPA